jgi:serine protease
MPRFINQFNIFIFAILLSACGGGGGSDPTISLFSISGQVSGLKGNLILNNDGDQLLVTENTSFSFETKVETDFKYNLSVSQQPNNQLCNLTNSSGTVAKADITNIIIECFDILPFSISGTVSNLEGSLTLSNNNDLLVITENSQFTFNETVNTGNTYNVEISNAPNSQACTISNSTGLILDKAITDVNVSCVNVYSISGQVSGLKGSLILNHSGDQLLITENTPFTFATKVKTDFKYNLNISQQTNNQFCNISNGSGTVTDADITNIIIECFDILPFSISGTISGLEGSFTLTNNNNSLVITDNGQFTFNETVNTGNTYNVEISNTSDTQVCTISNSSGFILDKAITDVNVSCVNAFSLTGTIKSEALVDVDSDVNDLSPNSNIANNDFTNAQPLNNYFTVNGFATADATNRAGDRFEFSSDLADIYKVNLQIAQELRLQIIDFENTSITGSEFQGDLDLILFNSSFIEIGRSESITEFESLTVPSQNTGDGTYYVVVLAFRGASKYVLSIDPVLNSSVLNFFTPQFVMNEAIIKFKEPSLSPNTARLNASSVNDTFTHKTFNNQPLPLSHTSYRRAMLTNFDSLTQTQTQAQAFSSNKASPQAEQNFLAELHAFNPESYEHYITLNTIKKLRVRDDVEYAHPNYIRTIKQTPNDTHFPKQWHYPAINLTQAWDITTGTPETGNVIVAVIDTGVFLNHEDLNGKLVPGYDFISDPSSSADNDGIDANPDDPGDGGQIGTSSWHGTHVAGTIAAETNNGIGVAGVSWGAKIMPLRALGVLGGTDYDIGQAALFAAGLANDSGTLPAQKADIINMSIGGPGGSNGQIDFNQDIFNRVRDAGVIIVAAAGNQNSSQPSYPAAYQGVISVAATDAKNERAPYSNFANAGLNSKIDIAAPGGDPQQDQNNDNYQDGVLSTLVDNSSGSRKSIYSFLEGTSMAAPHVAGVIALMRAVYPNLSPAEFDALLASGSITNDIGVPGKDDFFGYGLIDAFKAVNEARKLANGGIVPERPPLVIASPSTLNLGASSSATITISNSGGGSPTITSFSVNTSWLSVTPNSINSVTGLGSYSVNIDRTDLPDSSNIGKVTFNINTESGSKTLDVQVSMLVGTVSTEGNIGTQLVLLIEPLTGEVIDQSMPSKDINGDYDYQFNIVPVGSYQILSGSDIDNDFLICQLGESCGGYPVLNRLSAVEVVNADIPNLDFVSGVLSSFGTTSLSSASVKAVKLQQDLDTEPPTPNKTIGVITE